MLMQRLLLPTLILNLFPAAVSAGEPPLEQELRAQLEDGVLQGDPQRMKTGDSEFLAIHMPADRDKTRGAVILLHDQGGNADSSQVIHPLRTGLPDHGWETLSLQLPLSARDAPTARSTAFFDTSIKRIDFAVKALEEQNMYNICLLGHGLGANLALHWQANQGAESVRALVLVAMDGGPSNLMEDLKKAQLPILDVIGDRDLEARPEQAHLRRKAAREAENPAYRQLFIQGADRVFRGQEDLLQARIRAWISRVMEGKETELSETDDTSPN